LQKKYDLNRLRNQRGLVTFKTRFFLNIMLSVLKINLSP
jgi:hypothetical protein